MSDLIDMLQAASRDDRLADGMLYRKAAEEIQRLSDELTKWRKGLNSISYDTKNAEIQNLKSKYHELLYQVEKNFPNESRHETALRYIRQAESHDNGPEKSEQPKDTGA